MNRRHFLTLGAGSFAATMLAQIGNTATGARQGSVATSAQGNRRLTVDGSNSSLLNGEFLRQAASGGVHCVHKSVHTYLEVGEAWRFTDQHADGAVITTTVAEILSARSQGKLAIVLGSQHGNEIEKLMHKVPMMTRGYLEPAMRAFYQLGLRCQGLCYNINNIFGGGCLEPAAPLTGEGRHFVETIHKLGMLLDVGGHTGEQTSLDAIALSAGVPVVCTHTNAAGLVPNARASSDRLLEAIAGTGGVIGITAINDFQVRSAANYREHGAVSPQAGLDTLLDQYDYVKRLVGVEHVALGPDFFWPTVYHHNAANSITFPTQLLSDGLLRTVKDFEDLSDMPKLIAGLRGRGWSEPDLDKVLGQNWLRVYQQVWGS